MDVTYYIKLFRAGADRHNGILMCLLLLVAETQRVNTEGAAHRCSVAVLKNLKQPLADIFQNECS